ncbi:MAG: hypothetical protein Q9201_003790 [Fulgogasparrea decipioides]
MSSTEDDVSQSNSPPFRSAQPRDDDPSDSGQRLAAYSSDESMEAVPNDSSSVPSSDQEDESESTTPVHAPGEQPEHSPRSESSIPPVKKPTARPNKFHGPPSTWRSWTAPERQLAESLDQLRAKDLSVHLYNFFWLKRQSYQVGKRKESSEQDNESFLPQSDKSWLPSKSWTAWPMPPDLVPRELEASTWEADEHQGADISNEPVRSSEDLRDLLAARVCKEAKERFLKRKWEDADLDPPAMLNDQRSASQGRVPGLAGDSTQPEEAEPVVLADDQRAKVILQPSVNHILGRLDALLMGLHYARNSYATYNKASANIQSLTNEEIPMNSKRKRKMSHRDTGETSDRRTISSTEILPDESEANAKSYNQSLRYRANRRKGVSAQVKAGLGLRNWSDVLGVASLCGWDSAIVARAAARCSDLFEEGITFRTLQEGHDEGDEVTYLPEPLEGEDLQGSRSSFEETRSKSVSQKSNSRLAGISGSQAARSDNGSGSDKVGGVHVDGFLQPIKKQKSWGRKRRPRREE